MATRRVHVIPYGRSVPAIYARERVLTCCVRCVRRAVGEGNGQHNWLVLPLSDHVIAVVAGRDRLPRLQVVQRRLDVREMRREVRAGCIG